MCVREKRQHGLTGWRILVVYVCIYYRHTHTHRWGCDNSILIIDINWCQLQKFIHIKFWTWCVVLNHMWFCSCYAPQEVVGAVLPTLFANKNNRRRRTCTSRSHIERWSVRQRCRHIGCAKSANVTWHRCLDLWQADPAIYQHFSDTFSKEIMGKKTTVKISPEPWILQCFECIVLSGRKVFLVLECCILHHIVT